MLYNEAVKWHRRPSDLIQIQDEYVAFCFDQAIHYWGGTIDTALEKVEGKDDRQTEAKRKAVLQSFLYPAADGSKPKSQFADPALMFG